MRRDLSDLRVEYRYGGLQEQDAQADPVRQFGDWFQAAVAAGLELPNAMLLATADAAGRPAARYVLLKEFDTDGFVFYTHSDSDKGRQLQENPLAALVFYWHPLHRQVRIEGPVERLDEARAEAYFATRPRGAQLSAWVAAQSSTLDSREVMHERVAALEQRYAGQPIPRPPHWYGYRVAPERMEFWQGQEDRLHDRLLYTRAGGAWEVRRLAP